MTGDIHWHRDADGVVVLTFDAAAASVNTMTDAFKREFHDTVKRIEEERDAIDGVVLTSAKSSFFAGGDLRRLLDASEVDRASLISGNRALKADLSRLENLAVPVVAAIGGSALGGGYEFCLAAHHRVMSRTPGAYLGLPEVTLGLIPGGGGIVRSVRLLGVLGALKVLLTRGSKYAVEDALRYGLIDDIVDDNRSLTSAAKKWIRASRSSSGIGQRWDHVSEIPGGAPSRNLVRQSLPKAIVNQLDSRHYPALEAIVDVAIQSVEMTMDAAMDLETYRFVDIALGRTAKSMIKGHFFDLQHVRGDRKRGEGKPARTVSKCVVVGAGMMGTGIANACARVGIATVLLDVSAEAAERGHRHIEELAAADVSAGRRTEQAAAAAVELVTATSDFGAAAGADCVIEAVFEDPDLKAGVFSAIEAVTSSSALLATNTSTLPITELARNVRRPADFIGMHFFSPVHRMPLVEVIRGRATSENTVNRALALAKQLGKTPIIVNDSRGFFTSRVIRSYLDEGMAMLADKIDPSAIESASRLAGYPASVLQLRDEINMRLSSDIQEAERKAAERSGRSYQVHPAAHVLKRMLSEGRSGRSSGKGFYDYAEGDRTDLWNGLGDLFGPFMTDTDLFDLQERLLVREAVEAARCFEEDVITSVPDANVGSLLGIGFPAWTGGVLQYIDGYDGGIAGFVSRAEALAAVHGDRFAPPRLLTQLAQAGGTLSLYDRSRRSGTSAVQVDRRGIPMEKR
ncbi:hypothetical protein CH306_26255 [Rhodococcus sp. 15-725-2-2b]|uniref:3-hydroxyacyl-CoA dehydrogenase NAD-binding domain-containing protein n=1 Tax=unclassified Rhodococcus (in: high G+C Gram-positive bacteria) TaxID=192944 RepID=UPI000B9A9E20|nr:MULTISPECIES: 3-hydroxyacyl-CoA dehydrogenase NAD-binding domain-containing protein [unclassified Rhodococcus (in: high G+C Gram-positive bacteria)]OZC63608.1 hypothetical protein CH277_22405 [Rhodococcus sp. 06-469-3-2]OZD40773.1 hypothetical protein CH264_24090 [Rhodococcus sp. 06-1477-1A]OZE67119.1 hypothetical protein CH306_26255 [Rhodococcus sp. 15-725-2-2b]